MSTITNSIKRTALDRKMDRIRDLEEAGKLGTKLTNRTLRKLMSNKLAVFGAVMFVVICILCFGAPLFTKYSPTQIDLRARMAEPGGVHLLGADQMGRDIWARMLYGGQIQAMPPMLDAKNFPGMRLIRPMYRVREADILAWRDDYSLQFLQCACKLTRREGDSRRQYVKALIKRLEEDDPKVSKNIFNSVHTAQLDTLVGWKHKGTAHTFLENLEKK